MMSGTSGIERADVQLSLRDNERLSDPDPQRSIAGLLSNAFPGQKARKEQDTVEVQ